MNIIHNNEERNMNFKNLRKSKKVSQTKLSKELSFDQTTISKWENSKSEPNCQTIIKLSKIFDCSIEEIVRCFAN